MSYIPMHILPLEFDYNGRHYKIVSTNDNWIVIIKDDRGKLYKYKYFDLLNKLKKLGLTEII